MNAIKGFALLWFALAATIAYGGDHTDDPLSLVKDNLESERAVLIDVREQHEWDAGHLVAARFVPLSGLRNGRGFGNVPRDKIVYVHCRSGQRALIAGNILAENGFQDVRPLRQGFRELVRAGFEAER